jgi:hypothetical protein
MTQTTMAKWRAVVSNTYFSISKAVEKQQLVETTRNNHHDYTSYYSMPSYTMDIAAEYW